MKIVDSYSEVFEGVKKVLTVFAHPDDQEVFTGGLVSRLTGDGKIVRSVVMNDGGKGFRNRTDVDEKSFGKMRTKEQKEAAKVLGVEKTMFIGLRDGEVEANIKNIEKIVKIIRDFRPDVVITHNPQDFYIRFFNTNSWVNHRDHRKTGEIVFDAVYPYSRDNGFFPEHRTKYGLKGHDIITVLITDTYTNIDVKYFKITKNIGKKIEALRKHKNSFDEETIEDEIKENKVGKDYYEILGLCITN